MATVEIRSLAQIREFLGSKQFTYPLEDEMTVWQLLDRLDAEFNLGELIFNPDRSLQDGLRIMLRGRDIRFLETDQLILHDGDIILIIPLLAGG